MKLITQRDQIRTVAERWKAQYHERKFDPATNQVADHWSSTYKHDSTLSIYQKLAALNGETATPADIEAIIGNDTWGKLSYRCTECNAKPEDAIIQVGEEPDIDSATVYLCRDCAAKVADAFRQPDGSVNPIERVPKGE